MAGFLAGFGQGALDYSNQLNSNAYRQALLQLNQQNQQLRARQVLAELANQKRQQQTQALFGQAITGAMAQPAAPFGQGPPQPGAGMMPSMLPSSFPHVPDATGRMADNSAALGLIAKDESGGQNIPNFRFDAGHTASGPLQITDTTWNRYAPSVGAPPLQYPASPKDRPVDEQYKVGGAIFNKEGFAPWANFNPKLAADLKMSPEIQQQGGQVAIGAAGMLPPQMVGRGGPDLFARLVERVAGSNAPDDVKGAALMQLLPLMSQEGQRSFQQQWEMLKFAEQQAQHREDVGLRTHELEAGRAQTRELAEERLDIQRQGLGLKKDAAEQKKQALLPPDVVDMLAEQGIAGDQSWKQNLGRGQQGAENIVAVQNAINKKLKERGESGADLATRTAEYQGLKAGERTLSQRTANIGMRINEAQRFAPIALNASEKVDRSQYPIFNKMYEAGLMGSGDENVVRLAVATQSLLNAYAAAVTPTGTPTEGSQNRAHALLDYAWSQGQFATAINQLLVEMDAASKSPETVREEFRRGASAPNAEAPPTSKAASGGTVGKYTIGQVIEKGGKRYRVIGGDLNSDPDVEPAQ